MKAFSKSIVIKRSDIFTCFVYSVTSLLNISHCIKDSPTLEISILILMNQISQKRLATALEAIFVLTIINSYWTRLSKYRDFSVAS